jgi:hypothetical protein
VTAKQLIAAARTAGIGLDAPGDRLVYQAPRGGLTHHARCFSCGDALGHPEAYGRCVVCELFYEQQPADRERYA